MFASASRQVSSAGGWVGALTLLGAVFFYLLGGWRSAIGLVGGAAIMTAALYLVAWRVEATKKGRRAKVPRALLIAAQIFKFALIFALLWLMVYILQVPAGSIASGVTVGVIALVLGFAKPRTAGRV
jgi:hypothetical protein